ncbi:MAG: hypothetical protein ACERIH_11395 [Labilibaculum antarcticum]
MGKLTLSDDVVYDGDANKIGNISLMNMGVGLCLNQKTTKIIILNVNFSYTFSRNFKFKYDDNYIRDFDFGNSFFVKKCPVLK